MVEARDLQGGRNVDASRGSEVKAPTLPVHPSNSPGIQSSEPPPPKKKQQPRNREKPHPHNFIEAGWAL